jgi:hypothetical protein
MDPHAHNRQSPPVNTNIKGRVMNYSLVNANCRTHFKIVVVAIFASILLGFTAQGSSTPSSNISTTTFAAAVAKPHFPITQSWAHAENISGCRLNAL